MKMFKINGIDYRTNDKENYFYKSTGKTDKHGNPIMMRIPRHVFEKAFEEYVEGTTTDWEEQADAEREARIKKQGESDREAEQNFNGKKQTKKATKPRKSKDIAFEYSPNGTDVITLTAKQVDFIRHLPDTNFWENRLDSMPWCDVLADEIGGQFAGKPMTVGAMISTLREKKLITVDRDNSRKGKPKYMALTDAGKKVAKELGLE